MSMVPNWYADPFGRFEQRFFDGSAWTPYVKDGEEHALDEPAGALPVVPPPVPAAGPTAPTATLPAAPQPALPTTPPQPSLLTGLPVLSLVASAAGAGTAASVVDEAGVRVGEVRRGLPVRRRPTFEVVDARGLLVAALRRPDKGDRKNTFEVGDSAGAILGRIRKDTVRGVTAYGLEGVAELLGFLRVDAGRDFRIEDRLGRAAASGVLGPTGRVVRVEDGVSDQSRPMLVVAALCFDVALG